MDNCIYRQAQTNAPFGAHARLSMPIYTTACGGVTYMPFYPVSEASSELLTLFNTEKESLLAHCYEPEPGIFIAESAKVTLRSLQAGYEPVALLADETQNDSDTQQLLSVLDQVPVYTASHQRFREISGYPMTRGVLCAFRRKKMPPVSDVLRELIQNEGQLQFDSPLRIAVLDNITNPANIGSIFRNAAALGIHALLLTKGCCDPLARRSLRVSMGTVFCLPWTLAKCTGTKLIGELRENGFCTGALALTDKSISILDPALARSPRLALLLGNEGSGLSKETILACDYTVKIPMQDGVDSLNVASASAVAFWTAMHP